MGYLIYDKSMSQDGFIAGANMRLEAGLGDDGERLHEWAFQDEAGMKLIQDEVAKLGAVICGRTTYDMSIPHWGPDGPTGPARVPLFVLSHSVPDDIPEGGVYTFVDDLETALARARDTAGDRIPRRCICCSLDHHGEERRNRPERAGGDVRSAWSPLPCIAPSTGKRASEPSMPML